MSANADLLRRAAALMRERAEGATPGPWHDVKMGSEGSVVLNDGVNILTGRKPATCREFADAEHIASWHPVVALAVADWLDALARAVERSGVAHYPEPASIHDAALAVARAYLGESA